MKNEKEIVTLLENLIKDMAIIKKSIRAINIDLGGIEAALKNMEEENGVFSHWD